MSTDGGESSEHWRRRAGEELSEARAALDREDERIGLDDDLVPGTRFPVLDDQHDAAAERVEAAEADYAAAMRDGLIEQ